MSNLPVHNIQPGELHVSDEPCRIKTLLGSCVSVTVRNTRKGFGGMNHFMLPEVIPERSRGKQDFRFGDLSTRYLLDKMLEYDSNRGNLEVKLFGGGRVVSALAGAEVGRNNVDVAKKILREYNLSPSKEYVEGESGMKLDFNTETGIVRVKEIKKSRQSVRKTEQREKTEVADILKSEGEEGIDFLEGDP
jgi:chemotaxis protein CheD